MIEIVDFRNKKFDEIEKQDNPCYDFKKYEDEKYGYVWERNYSCILITKVSYHLFGQMEGYFNGGYIVIYCPSIVTDKEPKIYKGYEIIDEQNVYIIGIFNSIEIAVDVAEFYSEEIWRLE